MVLPSLQPKKFWLALGAVGAEGNVNVPPSAVGLWVGSAPLPPLSEYVTV